MEHLRSDIAELPQLGVGDALDGAGVLHDLGVGHEEAGDVGPVFVDVGVQRRRRQSAGDVAAAAGEGLDAAVGHGPVEAGDHHPAAGGGAAQGLVAGGLIHGAVQPEAEPADAVQKIVAQIVRHEAGGEVLAPAHQLVLTDATVHLLPQGGELRLQRCGQVQLVPDGEIAAADHVEHSVTADAILQVGVAQIQQVRQFVVVPTALSGGADHHHTAAGVRVHNGLHLGKLMGVGHRGAAEFQYL